MPVFQHPRSLFSRRCLLEFWLVHRAPADKVLTVRFLRSGGVCLTFSDSGTCDDVLEKGLDFDGVPLRLLPADSRLRTVFLCDLPVQISDAVNVVSSFCPSLGQSCPLSTVVTTLSRHCKMEIAL